MKQQWEYTVFRANSVEGRSIQDALDLHGIEGWELVAVHPQPPHATLVFKRPKQ